MAPECLQAGEQEADGCTDAVSCWSASEKKYGLSGNCN